MLAYFEVAVQHLEVGEFWVRFVINNCSLINEDRNHPTDPTLSTEIMTISPLQGLVWFNGISTIVGYLMPNPFLFLLTVLFQTTNFSISSFFVYTQLNVKRGLFKTIQFSVIIQFKCQNSSSSNNSV